MEDHVDSRIIRVYVHLAYGLGAATWAARWRSGQLLGINEDNAYGYQQAQKMGCSVEQSEDIEESAVGRLWRLCWRAILGFDLIHAWRNRRAWAAADIVWTHTESQSLAILALRSMRKKSPPPKIIAQTVWLMDSWPKLPIFRRVIYKALLKRADVLTFHSCLSVERARSLFPGTRAEFVRFGILMTRAAIDPARPVHTPCRVLSLGNDRHRDWPTLITAVANRRAYQLKVVTSNDVSRLTADANNITVERPVHNDDLIALYDWADFVVLCLSENLHASGITVIEEAVSLGVPVICTATGDLERYFTGDEISYIEGKDPATLRKAIDRLTADETTRNLNRQKAYARMRDGGINSAAFVAQHVAMSRALLGLGSPPAF